MKRSSVYTFLIAFFITTSLSSCVSIRTIKYLEPVGANKGDWEVKKQPDAYYWGFNNILLTRPIKDVNGKKLGSITMNFEFKNYSTLGFWITDDTGQLLSKIDLNSTTSNNIRDSLKKKGIGTGDNLPYNKFQIVINDNKQAAPAKLKEFFMGYTNLRNFNIYDSQTLQKGQKVNIITGDPYLDSIFQQYNFIAKTKTRIALARILAMLGH